jgi:putative flippase GtrA
MSASAIWTVRRLRVPEFTAQFTRTAVTRLSLNTPQLVSLSIDPRTLGPETGRMTPQAQPATLSLSWKTASRMSSGIGKFVIAGGSGAVLNTAVLYLLHGWLHVPLAAASIVAVELAVVNNYLINNRWTFPGHSSSLRRFARFNASSLVGLAFNVIFLLTLTDLGVHFVVANLVGIAAGFAVNFTLSFNWVWAGGS